MTITTNSFTSAASLRTAVLMAGMALSATPALANRENSTDDGQCNNETPCEQPVSGGDVTYNEGDTTYNDGDTSLNVGVETGDTTVVNDVNAGANAEVDVNNENHLSAEGGDANATGGNADANANAVANGGQGGQGGEGGSALSVSEGGQGGQGGTSNSDSQSVSTNGDQSLSFYNRTQEAAAAARADAPNLVSGGECPGLGFSLAVGGADLGESFSVSGGMTTTLGTGTCYTQKRVETLVQIGGLTASYDIHGATSAFAAASATMAMADDKVLESLQFVGSHPCRGIATDPVAFFDKNMRCGGARNYPVNGTLVHK